LRFHFFHKLIEFYNGMAFNGGIGVVTSCISSSSNSIMVLCFVFSAGEA